MSKAGFQKLPRILAKRLAKELDGYEAKMLLWMLGTVQVRQSRKQVRIPGTTDRRPSARGEIITSYPNIGKATGLSESTIRRRLAALTVRYRWLTVECHRGYAGTQGGTLITLDLDAIEAWDERDQPGGPVTSPSDQSDRLVSKGETCQAGQKRPVPQTYIRRRYSHPEKRAAPQARTRDGEGSEPRAVPVPSARGFHDTARDHGSAGGCEAAAPKGDGEAEATDPRGIEGLPAVDGHVSTANILDPPEPTSVQEEPTDTKEKRAAEHKQRMADILKQARERLKGCGSERLEDNACDTGA